LPENIEDAHHLNKFRGFSGRRRPSSLAEKASAKPEKSSASNGQHLKEEAVLLDSKADKA
jgi:hypothetical protein